MSAGLTKNQRAVLVAAASVIEAIGESQAFLAQMLRGVIEELEASHPTGTATCRHMPRSRTVGTSERSTVTTPQNHRFKLGGIRSTIVEALRGGRTLSTAELESTCRAMGVRYQSVSNALTRLKKDGILEQPSLGQYRLVAEVLDVPERAQEDGNDH